MIDKILRGTGSPRLKERALFVLAQNGTPQARQIVMDIAKGGGNPDLQAKAVTYLGALGGAGNQAGAARDLQGIHQRRREAQHPARVHDGRRSRAAA